MSQKEIYAQSSLEFPEGMYQQNISIHFRLKENDKWIDKDFDFDCIVQKKHEHLEMKGFNGFGISLFTLTEDSKSGVQFKTDIDLVRKNEAFFQKIYPLIKQVLYLNKTKEPKQSSQTIVLSDAGIEHSLAFLKRDGLGIPVELRLFIPEKYEVFVETKKYTLTP